MFKNIERLLYAAFWLFFFYVLIKPLIKQDRSLTDESDITTDISTETKAQVELPLHDVVLPEFSKISDIKQKKKQFFDFLRPAIIQENSRISHLRGQLTAIEQKLQQAQLVASTATPSLLQPKLILNEQEQQLINELAKQYRLKKNLSLSQKIQQLLTRVDIVPTPLVLVQAANESAWGTSRFARIGLNFFGIWCYRKGCGMVPNGRDQGLRHEVAAFQSVEQAVSHYLHNINTNNAYHVFRTIRAQLHEQKQPLSAEILVTGLLPYSERGTDYVIEISEMIRHNKVYLFQ
ncbi:glucosaminidase domain-containing protein [Colwelliaceae bacterium 6441]